MVYKFFIFFAITIISLATGYLMKGRGIFTEKNSKLFILIGVLFFETPIVFFALWNLSITKEFIWLPASGFILTLCMSAISFFIAKLKNLENRKIGAFVFSSALSNQGYTMGGFICYLFYGEKGFGLSVLYLLYYHLFVYLLAYPLANYLSENSEKYFVNQITQNFKDIRFLPVYMMLLGLALNGFGISAPEWSSTLIGYMIPPATAVILFAIGIQINFSMDAFKEAMVWKLLFLKFFISPILAIAFFQLVCLDGISQKVIFIQASMPSAIYSVVISNLFNLDKTLATKLFISSHIFFFLCIFPLLFFII